MTNVKRANNRTSVESLGRFPTPGKRSLSVGDVLDSFCCGNRQPPRLRAYITHIPRCCIASLVVCRTLQASTSFAPNAKISHSRIQADSGIVQDTLFLRYETGREAKEAVKTHLMIFALMWHLLRLFICHCPE